MPEDISPQEFIQALRYVFDEYNQAKDGNMTRKEFFTFLWELKQTAKQALNEGQMMSCWVQVSRKKETITFKEFQEGLEICYDNHFFARENGLPILMYNEPEEQTTSYNTLKFQKSQGVAAFQKILEEEHTTKRQMTVYGQPSPNRPATGGGGGWYTSNYDTPLPRTRTDDAPTPRQPPAIAPKPADTTPTPITNFHMKMVALQRDRDTKKVDAQKKMDQILSERYQEQRRQREQERLRLEDEKARQRTEEMAALTSEPAWKRDLKNRAPPRRF